MNWTLLFILFIFIFLISMTLIYFTVKPSSSSLKNFSHNQNILNNMWKW